MISLNDVLLAASNIPVDDPIAEIWGRGLQGGYKIIEYIGTLPITITANGDALLDYRIYGASGGVGVATENVFDYTATDTNNGYVSKSYISADGDVTSSTANWCVSEYIQIQSNTNYFLKIDTGGYNDRGIAFYDSNKNYISGLNYRYGITNLPFLTPSNAEFVRLTIRKSTEQNVILVKGSTAPTNYIPYGYKLPMTVSDENTAQAAPVYIGENQLNADEYVSYGERKIYKRTENLYSSENELGNINYQTGKNDSSYNDRSRSKDYISVKPSTTYTLVYSSSPVRYATRTYTNNTYITYSQWMSSGRSFTTSNLTTRIRFIFDSPKAPRNLMLVEGSTAPVEYIPYLQPQEPPVPLPEIPTIKGETVIDYDGEPKPSQMYIKYKGKG